MFTTFGRKKKIAILRIFLRIKSFFPVKVRASLFHTGPFAGDYFLTGFHLIYIKFFYFEHLLAVLLRK